MLDQENMRCRTCWTSVTKLEDDKTGRRTNIALNSMLDCHAWNLFLKNQPALPRYLSKVR